MHEQSIRMGEGGRLVIPAVLRKEMGVGPGDALVARYQDGELRLFRQKEALTKLQAAVEKCTRTNPYSVDDFLRERRSYWGE